MSLRMISMRSTESYCVARAGKPLCPKECKMGHLSISTTLTWIATLHRVSKNEHV